MRRLSSSITSCSIRVVGIVAFAVTIAFGQSSPHGPIKQACVDCHSTVSWKELAKPMKFNHTTTGFLLQGAHANAQCLQCHTTKRFTGTSTDCFTCHTADFAKALIPNHQLGKFSHDCLTCHTMTGWRPSIFQHSKTNFQLTGAHLSVECASCHTNNRFAGLSRDCFICHQKDFVQTISPNHKTGQFSHDCLSCHSLNGWQPATFDHSKTNFRLVGAHATIECSSCHTGGKFKSLPRDCFSCHNQDYTKTTKPNHASSQLSHDCLTCHTDIAWKPSTFEHSKTNYPLVGAHTTAECSSCHTNGRFKGLPTDCYSCHTQDFMNVKTIDHVKLSHDCLTCHTNIVWKPATFDHNKTKLQLTGAHLTAECSSCHSTTKYVGLPTDCYTCHQQEFAKTITPNHSLAQFSHDCLTCHTTMVWKPSTFDHNKTNFQLVGAHKTVECSSCHASGVYKGLPSDCFSCHQNNFASTTNPNHTTAQFSHDCLTCHSTISWKPSTFNHSTTTFPLVGAHAAVTCASCHSNGVYKGLPSDCFSCHQANFNSTTNPNHTTAQFSHDCLTCHSTISWKPSTFNHSTTAFPLVGAHAAVVCGDCHKNGQYKGTSAVCYDCHLTAFNNTSAPSHVTSQFSHDCLTCHSNVAWKPATFNHSTTTFPLVGAHASASCASCHKNGVYKGTSTDCYICHQSDYNGTTSPAHATANFPTACISCHTSTAWVPSTFNHTLYFPIGSGDKHRPGRWTVCTDCHNSPTNFKIFTCIACHEHSNQPIVDKDHQGVAGYVYESNACYKCHPKGRS